LLSGDDLADVSGHEGGGTDDSTNDVRGAIYHGNYDLIQDIITGGDTTIEESGYYTTAGDYTPDNSTNVDENDAKVWFTLSDTYEPPDPNLEVTGSLNGTTKIGTTHYHLGTFTIENQGIDPIGWQNSYLDWEIAEIPSWGANWEFDPNGGTNLESGDSTTVHVYVDVPTEQGTFTGSIKILNSDNHGDYGVVPIELETPIYKQPYLTNLLELLKINFRDYSSIIVTRFMANFR
jgi:hypothetical protein